jgi:hypothetical protein
MVVALLLVALSVGLDNFAASTALGVTGVDRRLRLRVAGVFGAFEGLMPVLGLLLGRAVAHELGGTAHRPPAHCSVPPAPMPLPADSAMTGQRAKTRS